MKTTLYIAMVFFFYQHVVALNIQQIIVSSSSDKAINVSLNTEAVELYYFQSWRYEISGTTITVEACFISGFGSTIAYLNNNFEIPLNTIQSELFHLKVRVYYTFYEPENLQDTCEGVFSTPFSSPVVLLTNIANEANENDLLFANPSNGRIVVSDKVDAILVIDISGKIVANFKNNNGEINITNSSDGIYTLVYFVKQRYKTARIILKKE
jgi:Secretion system C-terminal sorting domain